MYRCVDILPSMSRASRKLILHDHGLTTNAKVAGSIPSRGQVELISYFPGSYSEEYQHTYIALWPLGHIEHSTG